MRLDWGSESHWEVPCTTNPSLSMVMGILWEFLIVRRHEVQPQGRDQETKD